MLQLADAIATLVLQKLVLCVPFLHGWQGSSGSKGGIKQMLSPGARSEAPGRSLRAGAEAGPRSQKTSTVSTS